MKKFPCILLVFILFLCSGNCASAEDVYSEAAKEFGTEILDDALSDDELSISGEAKFDGSYDVGAALARLWRSFVEKIVFELKDSIAYFTSLLSVALLSSIAIAVCVKKESATFIEIISCSAAAVLAVSSMDSLVSQTVDAMYRLSDYSKAALPVVFTAAAAGGAVGSSAAKFAAVTFALDVLMSLAQNIIIPVIYSFLAVSVSEAVFPNPIVCGIKKLCKWTAGTLMSAMTIAFTTYISMVGAIGAAVDTTAVKAARTLISGVLPVVGGMISDASAMVLSAAGVIKSSAGVFGLITVCIMCVGPFAILSVKMLLFKFVSAVADSMESKKLSTLFASLGSAMSLLLGLLGSCGIMLFISLTAGLKAVSI